jgi:hypothetical protein
VAGENVEKMWIWALTLPKIWQKRDFFDKKFSTFSTDVRVEN